MRIGQVVWTGLVAAGVACGGGPTEPEPSIDSPADAVFVTSDIDHFWAAIDAGVNGDLASALQREYLDRASPGLRDFIQARNVTATALANMVRAYPMYFADIRPNTLQLSQQTALLDRIRANFETMESLYPPAVYPPITFLIGRFSTGGTTRPSGILIGTEFFAIDDDTPLGELGAFQRANVKPIDSIPAIVAHEHAHILQGRAGGILGGPNRTLLQQSLVEGAADFLGELVAGSHINGKAHAYGLAHEEELWNEFTLEMNGTNVSRWLYNQGSASGSRPGDLGYFIGYRIAQAYYNKMPDKKAAVRDIIEIQDASAFLQASGYDGSPPSPPPRTRDSIR